MASSTDRTSNEMFFQIVALLLSIIIVHTIYVTVIRPNAENIIKKHAEMASAGEQYEVPRSFFVVIKDLEQESCFILMLWSLSIMGYKSRIAMREKSMLSERFFNLAEGTKILPQDVNQLIRPIESISQEKDFFLLPRTLKAALSRFEVTNNVQFASEAIDGVCEAENDRLDSELSMIRYITWAIPSIGFIGTVRGIGAALGQAHEAMQGDIAGVTSSLGVAFNSTFIALLISMVVMFFMHQLQLMQERLVLDSHSYCENNLLRFMKASE
ncbi:MotA/TolQ/ExbB proton channel family protein [Gammaproteobacteria bacterium]|nr:MotA/TolQ/ExbB proton channel family protein [Gammaproteobacteria bacterium]